MPELDNLRDREYDPFALYKSKQTALLPSYLQQPADMSNRREPVAQPVPAPTYQPPSPPPAPQPLAPQVQAPAPTPPPVAPQPISVAPGPTPGDPYMSDIASLRAMPQGLVDSYKRYIESIQGNPRFAELARAEAERLGIDPAGWGKWQGDIDYLREVPGKGEFESSFLTEASQNVDRKYAAAQQNIIRQASMRGIDPSSGVIQEQIRRLEEAKASEKAGAERQLSMWRMGEARSRRGEARGIDQLIEEMRTGRRGRGIGLEEARENAMLGRRGMETSIFREMDALEQQRRGAARGIEGQLDANERQRLMDLMGYLQGAQPSSAPAALSSQNALLQAGLAGQAGSAFGGALGDTAQSMLYYYLMKNPGAAANLFGPPK